MSEPTETMREMAELAEMIGCIPGADKEKVARVSAEKMRETIASRLAEFCDDCDEVDIYNLIRTAEDRVLEDDDIDTGDLVEGQVRMRCQIVLIDELVEAE